MTKSAPAVPSNARSAGVTLIELMIVLTMISVIVGIVFWKIDIARYQINGDQQVLGTALIAAQRQAIAKQHNVIVVFDDVDHEMRIVSDSNNNGQADPGENVRSISLGDRVRYGLGSASPMTWGSSPISFTVLEGSSGMPAVIFYRNGSASESRGVYLASTRALADPAYVRDVRAIHVERATGRAEWWHYDGSTWLRGF
jgi:prepilin-type N-terminal cleavage/methylation domain-containing protein